MPIFNFAYGMLEKKNLVCQKERREKCV